VIPAGPARAQPADGGPGRALTPDDFAPLPRAEGVRRAAEPALSYWPDAWRRLRRDPQALAALALVIALAAFSLAGPLVWRADPAEQDPGRVLEPPSIRRTAVVAAEPAPLPALTVPGVPPRPAGVDGASLPAPAALDWLGEPTTLSVRLRWAPVPGAAGYLVYRSLEPPRGETLGLPVGEVPGGNVVSFEDTFRLEPRTYWYSVVATNGSDSPRAVTRSVRPAPVVPLTQAVLVRPGAAPGETVAFPARPLGTDGLGRDVLARLMAGGRVSLFIGFLAPLLAMAIGLVIGGIAGALGGRVDAWLMRITDFTLALPFLLFVILFRVVLGAGGGTGTGPLIAGLVALSWTGTARLVRGQVLQLRGAEYVQAARLLGAGPATLLARHLLPNTLGVVLVEFTFGIPSAIFTEAFLSFIGMGVVPPTPSWGSMCSDALGTLLTAPHQFAAPAVAIALSVLAFNLLGDGLRDALDPRLRSRS
jgi:oligopeptide transport system permease protein